MSITVSTCQQIYASPLNTSMSKNLWTFSKQDRFTKSQSSSNCQQAFYNLPSVIDQRKAGIGKGEKSDFTKLLPKTPAPDQYELKGDTQINQEKNKGFQFGVSREKMMQTSILGNLNKTNPGPGKYNLGNTLSQTKYSFRPKLNTDFLVTNKYVPGPGTYPTLPSINEKGRYANSKFHNSCASLFNPPRSKRFTETYQNDVPGPGNYQTDKIGIQKDGQYFVSTFHSSLCRSFPHGMRRTGSVGTSEKTPGPGTYRLPSEFGYYEAKNQTQAVASNSPNHTQPVTKSQE